MNIDALQTMERHVRAGLPLAASESLVLIDEIYRLRGIVRRIRVLAEGMTSCEPRLCQCGMPSCTYKEDHDKWVRSVTSHDPWATEPK